MSKLFLNTIVQYGGKLSNSDKITILNAVSKHINKKIKIIEYKYGIKIKLDPLSVDNSDIMPKNILIDSFAKIDTNLKGNIPIYTNAKVSLPTPTISTVTAGIPLTPIGPFLGVPAIGINPFGNTNTIDDKNNKAIKYIEILKSIENELEKFKNGLIEKKNIDTTYFEFIDLEPDSIDNILSKYVTNYNKL